ncbi:MAG TPA: PP2C family protein-serine/threonine phosphatase [Nocardioides sp.]|nr:PP2C family protein-serine/threonine phosphatase [Nocardioides sp.]
MQPLPAGLPVEGRAVIGEGRRWFGSDRGLVVVLCLASVIATGAVVLRPEKVPINLVFVPIVLAVLFLSNRVLQWYAAFQLAMLTIAVVAAFSQASFTSRTTVGIPVMFLLTVTVFVVARGPGRLGIARLRGESMLVDLRDRILAQGEIPPLPDPWLVDSALSSAGGSPFAGDFVVATRRNHGHRLELAVVDVSGKGEAAGIRALQLSGAMGGLLGALPADEFLGAANGYLLQRAWEEGFATAVHLSLDLETGVFEVRGAGHPPAAQRHAGSGRWQILRTEGPVLGVLEDVSYDACHGRLAPGDSLVLYTDGMVEEPRRDIELGIDAMLGEAESLLRGTWDGLAARLVAAVGSPEDDRALLVVHRRP